jgi:hypothetical protein
MPVVPVARRPVCTHAYVRRLSNSPNQLLHIRTAFCEFKIEMTHSMTRNDPQYDYDLWASPMAPIL